MGLSLEEVQASLRFSLGRFTTGPDVGRAAQVVADCVLQQKRAFGRA